MRLLDTIKALNAAAARAFKLRPQNSFMATRTLLYDGEDTINRFAEEIADFLEEYEVLEEQLVQFTAESMLGIMVSRVKMAKKCGLLQMVLKWSIVTKCPTEVVACIVQSLYSPDLPFGEVYVIRMAIWNYVSKPDLQETTTLRILPTGLLDLQLRNRHQFINRPTEEYIFIIEKLRLLVRSGFNPTHFRSLVKYDYTLFSSATDDGLKKGPLSIPVRQYAVSGFKGHCFPDKLFMDYYLPPVKKESEKKLVDVKNEKEKGEEMEMEDHEETSEEEFATSTDSDSPELFDESDEMDRVLDFTSHKTIRVRQ